MFSVTTVLCFTVQQSTSNGEDEESSRSSVDSGNAVVVMAVDDVVDADEYLDDDYYHDDDDYDDDDYHDDDKEGTDDDNSQRKSKMFVH